MSVRHIRKCDRCQREQGDGDDSEPTVIEIQVAGQKWGRFRVIQKTTIVFPEGDREDLCPGCLESLKLWWGNPADDVDPPMRDPYVEAGGDEPAGGYVGTPPPPQRTRRMFRPGKPPPLNAAIRAAERVLVYGNEKHGQYSYLTDASTVREHIEGVQRHLFAANRGELTDKGSGEHPLAHVVARAVIALELTLREKDGE